MPLTVTAAYRAKHAQRSRTPYYIVEFSRAGEAYVTHRVESYTQKLLQIPTGFAASIEPEKGRSQIESFSFVLVDEGGAITRLVAQGVGGDTVTLKDGFRGLALADFAVRNTGLVTSVKLTGDKAAYEFECMTPDTLMNRQAFETAVNSLSEDIDDVEDAIPMTATTFFLSSGYVIIDQEIIQYAGREDTSLTGCTRGALGSVAAEHSERASVTEMLRLGPAHPIDIFLGVLQNTDKTGLGISPDFIDLAGIAAVKADIDSSNPIPGEPYQMEFRIAGRENAKDFIENELMAPMACYRVMTSGGLISMKQFRQPSASNTEVIDHDSILGDDSNPLQLSWDENLSSVINSVTLEYDHDIITNEFKSKEELESAASIEKYGKRPLVISARGLRSELPGTNVLIQARVGSILNRYKDSAPLVELTTFLQRGLVEPGDIVRVSSSVLPNRFTLQRGVENALMEVIGRTLNFAAGTVSFTLLATGFGLAGVYAPEVVSLTWGAATQPEREQYIFYADENGLNGNSIPGQRYAF